MICPKCKELGWKSKVYVGTCFTTAMYCPTYFDEDGKLHNHDSNSSSQTYNCSMGHAITVTPSNKCANCDFGHEQVISVYDNNEISGKIIINSNERIDLGDIPNVGTIKIG